MLILHQAGPPAERQIAKGHASHGGKGWEMYYLNTIYFTATLKIRFAIASETEQRVIAFPPFMLAGSEYSLLF